MASAGIDAVEKINRDETKRRQLTVAYEDIATHVLLDHIGEA